MFALVLITLILGIVFGLTLTISSLWIFKIKCPECKKLKPAKEIIFFQWKTREITGKKCQRCQRPKSQVEIY